MPKFHSHTCGVIAWLTAAGFVIEINEMFLREGAHQIIDNLVNIFSKDEIKRQYYNILKGVGYDMNCTIYKSAWKIIKDQKYPKDSKEYEIITGLNRDEINNINDIDDIRLKKFIDMFFVDKMHVRRHTNPNCIKNNGKFNPYGLLWLDKLLNVNTQIAEQFWSRLNKISSQTRTMSEFKLKLLLHHVSETHNEILKIKLIKQGVKFIPINEWNGFDASKNNLKWQENYKNKLERQRQKKLERLKELRDIKNS